MEWFELGLGVRVASTSGKCLRAGAMRPLGTTMLSGDERLEK